MNGKREKTRLKKFTSFIAICSVALLATICTFVFAESVAAHGYVESPASRAYLCSQGINTDCGPIQYEPQSLEGQGSFPEYGPADGEITGAGVFTELFEQRADRWEKVTINGGMNAFTWRLTAPHSTAEWKYYITKKDWDPNRPLARADLELFCYFNDGGSRPPARVVHECDVPTDRSGYHLILGVWEIGDTDNAFYNVIDIHLVNEDTGEDVPTAPLSLHSTVQTESSIQLEWAASTSPHGIEEYHIFRNGNRVASTAQTIYVDTGLASNTAYTYQVKAVDRMGNESPLSNSVTVKTRGTDTCANLPTWNKNEIYLGGNKVQYHHKIYEARWWTQGEQPGTTGEWGVWSYIEDCSDTESNVPAEPIEPTEPDPCDPTDPHHPSNPEADEWAPSIYYPAGDLIIYHGKTYRSLQSHTSLQGWEPNRVPALWQEE